MSLSPTNNRRDYAKVGDQKFLPHPLHPDLFAVPGELCITRRSLERLAKRHGLAVTYHATIEQSF